MRAEQEQKSRAQRQGNKESALQKETEQGGLLLPDISVN